MKKARYKILDSWRFLLSIAVVLHHTLWYFWPQNVIQKEIILGGASVSFFFVLSGFVLYYRHRENLNVKEYYFNIAIRIYPLHWFILTCFLLIIGSNNLWFKNPNFFEITTTFLGLNSFVPYKSYIFAINPISWFISAIIFMSAIFPYLYFQIQKNKHFKIIFSTLISYIALAIATNYLCHLYPQISIDSFLKFNPLSRLFQFIIGIYMAFCFINYPKFSNNMFFSKNNSLLLLGASVLLYSSYLRLYTNDPIVDLTVAMLLETGASALIIFLSIINRGDICYYLEKLNKLGKYSFSIFVFHPLLSAYLFYNKFYNSFSMELRVIIYGLFLTVFSILLTWLFEQKLTVKLKRRY